MKLKDMMFIKTNNKVPRESGGHKYYPYSKELDEENEGLGVGIPLGFVVVDVDNINDGVLMAQVIRDKEIKCNIQKTDNGYHFWFKSQEDLSNNVKYQTMVGVDVDIRSGTRQGYVVVKRENVWREWIEPVYDFDELDTLPKWFCPFEGKHIKEKYDVLHIEKGERNDTLFRYCGALFVGKFGFTREDIVEGINIINKYMLKKPLPQSDIDTITREDAFKEFSKDAFFEGNRFLHHVFGDYFIETYGVHRRKDKVYCYYNNRFTSDKNDFFRLMNKEVVGIRDAQKQETYKYIVQEGKPVDSDEWYYIRTNNCILDVRDMSTIPLTKDKFMITQLTTNYNPLVTSCPVVENVMKKISCGNEDVEDILWQMFGYCLIPTSKFSKAFILHGSGGNGKSTILDMLANMIGTNNISSLSLKDINSRFRLEAIEDKLANIGDDISGEYLAETSEFKKVVTGEDVQIERKGEQPYAYRNVATMIFATNHLPKTNDRSKAMARRLVIIPLDAEFSPNDKDYDPFIGDKLKEQQAREYVLNKSLEGLAKVIKNNTFVIPPSIKLLSDKYIEYNNNVITFLKEHKDYDFEGIKPSELYRKYVMWCAEESETVFKKSEFETAFINETKMQNKSVYNKVLKKNVRGWYK